MLTLYTAPGSCGRASHIALEESGLPFEVRLLDLSAGDQRRPDYIRINPKGRVPALITASGVLTESPAILSYIASMATAVQLAPCDDPFALAALHAFNAYLASTVHVAHAHGRRASRWADAPDAIAAMQAKVAENMRACFLLIEEEYLRGEWAMGSAYTIADPYLFTMTGWLQGDGVDLADFPKVADHYGRMLERPAVRRALAAEKG
ncbi:glutathione S-transferase N-terminal domain-containing protein [Rhizobiaceae bacterium BDR2-2]|uniref:Glutathione S-transferase N-terminal domain-containing protein n=1 Tax=Ectorhizobium quercum TaxID=2965071 RepID=A0AAE3SVN5_9HYPH|nr:glutathione S-transferase N-terminal domain-containing protein [Ectorhizobium quercum]MCX8998540.1 glutathione S-transferase N-terminal domain-containing protein [Ectorhizobium quercum]